MTGIQTKKITCDGSKHTLASQCGNVQAKWLKINSTTGNATLPTFGSDGSVASDGFPVAAGSNLELPPIAELTNFYDFTKISYDGANSITFTVMWSVG